MSGKISTTGMFKDSDDGSSVYYPNGIWSKKGYLLRDTKQRKALTTIVWMSNVLVFGAVIVGLLYESWLLFVVLLLALHFIYLVVTWGVIKNNVITDELVTFKEITIQHVQKTTTRKLYFTSFFIVCLLGRAMYKVVFVGDELEYYIFSSVVFLLLSWYSVYAIRVKKQFS